MAGGPKSCRDGRLTSVATLTATLALGALGCGGQLAGGTPDAGTCSVDGGIDPSETPASGSFSGPAMSGVICGDGALVYVEDNLRGTVSAALYGNQNLQTPGGIRFEIPANVVEGELSIGVGMQSPTAGTYDSATTCGSVVLGAFLPVPPGLDCYSSAVCPPGCALQGPINAVTCMPVHPAIDFVAQTPKNCLGYAQTSGGSFKLVLSSVELEPTDAGATEIHRYRVHGNLTASLVGQAGDAGTSTVALSLTF